MKFATLRTAPQTIAGGPSFPTLKGCELLASLKLAAVAAVAASTSRAPASPFFGLSESVAPQVLPARTSDRHFAQSENAFNFHKTKGGREIRSTVNPAWGGRLSRAMAAVARFRSPRGARPRNAQFLIRYQQLEIHVSHRQHEPNSNSNPQIPRFWPRGFAAFVAHYRPRPERRSCARAENFGRYGII